jgi:hypothetical protein
LALRSTRLQAALEAVEKIAPAIFKIVEVSKLDLERGIPASPSAEIRLLMISRNKITFMFTTPALELSIKKQSRPTIVILSTSKLYRKQVVALLRKDKQLEKYPEFEFAGFSRNPANQWRHLPHLDWKLRSEAFMWTTIRLLSLASL